MAKVINFYDKKRECSTQITLNTEEKSNLTFILLDAKSLMKLWEYDYHSNRYNDKISYIEKLLEKIRYTENIFED